MKLVVLDQEFRMIDTIDKFTSCIWTDRYAVCGDFELVFPMDINLLATIQNEYYLWYEGSDHLMIIENIVIKTDDIEGSTLNVTGRSIESILDRRIIWGQTILNGNVQVCVKRLITENIISPAIADRKIPNFIFEDSTDTNITGTTIQCQFTGDNLYDAITSICDTCNIGFKITLNDANQFVFKLYCGIDRSYEQEVNSHVIFSPTFDNLSNSNYIYSKKTWKNVTWIAGEGEGAERRTSTIGSGNGLDRRELFTDARDISSKVDDRTLTDAEYIAQLQQRGTEKLAENVVTNAFEGLVDPAQMFIFRVDYDMGDIVQITNEYGMEGNAYIEEVINSQDRTGFAIYPTFKSI